MATYTTPSNVPANDATSKKTEAIKSQVEEVTQIMQTNLTRAMERDGKIENLDERADNLNTATATEFRLVSQKVNKRSWWQAVQLWFKNKKDQATKLVIQTKVKAVKA
ncbi:hypothetical protein SK128_012073 [Halocaridina rubra]|uniref:V-SNARE coiled-coil homology domain-containing protein n=1 Tax=Halocaridina rubra TaxID=373956 RepID=A0AAN8WLL5_HALRR